MIKLNAQVHFIGIVLEIIVLIVIPIYGFKDLDETNLKILHHLMLTLKKYLKKLGQLIKKFILLLIRQ